MYRWMYLGRTVENRADEHSGEIGLFPKVKIVGDLRCDGIIRPWLLLVVRHGSDAYKGGRILVESGIEGGSEVKKGP